MTNPQTQALIDKLQMLGKRVELYHGTVLSLSNKPDNEGYSELTIYIMEDGVNLTLVKIPSLDNLIQPNTKLIITGTGKPKTLTIGLEGRELNRNYLIVKKITKIIMNVDTYNMSNMQYMFFRLSSLREIEFKRIDTHAVKDMGGMFWGCEQLERLDLSKFDTTSLQDMSHMFCECISLKELNLSSFNTPQLRYLTSTFKDCREILSLDLSSFNAGKCLLSMKSTFFNCRELRQVNLGSFDLNNVESFVDCFYNCYSISKIEMPPSKNMELNNATTLEGMFKNCLHLSGVDMSPVIGSKVTSIDSLFEGCANLKAVLLSRFQPSELKNISFAFENCSELVYLDIRRLSLINIDSCAQFLRTKQNLVLILARVQKPKLMIALESKIDYMNETFIDQTSTLLLKSKHLIKNKNLLDLEDEWSRQAGMANLIFCRGIKILHPVSYK